MTVLNEKGDCLIHLKFYNNMLRVSFQSCFFCYYTCYFPTLPLQYNLEAFQGLYCHEGPVSPSERSKSQDARIPTYFQLTKTWVHNLCKLKSLNTFKKISPAYYFLCSLLPIKYVPWCLTILLSKMLWNIIPRYTFLDSTQYQWRGYIEVLYYYYYYY